MRKKLLVVGCACLALVLGTLYFVVSKKTAPTNTNVCLNMIADIRKQDVNKSYALFSAAAQKTIDKTAWGTTVSIFANDYAASNAAPVFVSRGDSVQADTKTQKYTEQYRLTTLGGSAIASCFIVKQGSSYTLEGYRSDAE